MNPKKMCPKCGKLKRTRCFIYNPVWGEKLCNTCNKKVGTNRFYSNKKQSFKKNKRITNFNITDEEKKVIARENGWKRVNQDLRILKSVKNKLKKRKAMEKENKKIEEEKKKEMNKRFIEGLK